MNRKVTVVGGAGNVGATVARSIAQRELADVVVVDIADSDLYFGQEVLEEVGVDLAAASEEVAADLEGSGAEAAAAVARAEAGNKEY